MSITNGKNCKDCACSINLVNPELKLCLPDKTFETTYVQLSPNGQKCVDGTVENCDGVEWCVSVDIPFKLCRPDNSGLPLPTPVEVNDCDISRFSGCEFSVAVRNLDDPLQDGFGTTIPISDLKVKSNNKTCEFDFDACFTLTGTQNDSPKQVEVMFFCDGLPPSICVYTSNVYVPEIVDDVESNQKYPYYDRIPSISATGYIGKGLVTGIVPLD